MGISPSSVSHEALSSFVDKGRSMIHTSGTGITEMEQWPRALKDMNLWPEQEPLG